MSTTGARLWRWKHRHAGKEKLMSFGMYPDVSLAKAGEMHRQHRVTLAAGIDPMAERLEQKRAEQRTFKHVAELWRDHWKVGKTPKHDIDVWRRLEADVFRPSVMYPYWT